MTADGQVTVAEGAEVLLAGDGGIVLGGRVASIDGGRVVIDLDGAAPAEELPAADYGEAERLAALGWVLMAPGAVAAAALMRDVPALAARLVTRGPGWAVRRLRKAAHADWGPSDAFEGR